MPADDPNLLRLQLIDRMLRLPVEQLVEVERLLESLSRPLPVPRARQSGPVAVTERDWPHAPLHRFSAEGTYSVTAATSDKAHFFQGAERLDFLETQLLAQLKAGSWQLEAWAVFSNHDHFIGHAQSGKPLEDLLRELHRSTGLHVNELDLTPGRRVWFNYWDTQLPYESSYRARLNYVHQNPVKHGLGAVANQYCWCSAAWFERTATPAQVKTIYSLKIDRVHIDDDFQPV